ncbi:hypothetical protein C3469_04345 [Mycobacterium kansasii]|uniref:hypothetical protein n=1 Tax=Mycobacterium kansasii TaxID=1768 RepID=UPI000CDE2B66|nr:hypothetical protein [Mycobacterium kansasii]POY04855.1 hypothetical protein C3479_00165 [Mycobacterium kansasii]POY29132.1 hypothetical protein C3469_04345 [Mycobacterium kansasii]POY34239.1 hypothetical protein C3478_02265 [Mycobacterium kansasii]
MKLLGRRDLAVSARPSSIDVRRVQLRMGSLEFLLSCEESIALARQLVAAVDTVREGREPIEP